MNINLDLELLDFWFGFMKDKWFGCTEQVDQLIKSKYENWMNLKLLDEVIPSQDKIILSRIILFDQIPRHIFRSDSIKELLEPYDTKARELLETSGLVQRLETLDPESRCFALLPWRHTFDPEYLNKCVKLVSSWKKTQPSQPIYRRFYQATIKALCSHYNKQNLIYQINPDYNIDLIDSILDPRSPRFNSNLLKTNLNLIPESNHLVQEFKSNISKLNPKPTELVISVSGGVDSMVCLILAKKCFPELPIKAISINYANRPEQQIEIDMCGLVCADLGVCHYVRVINEIKRTRDFDREFYETTTREIRFGCYYQVTEGLPNPVILGHNQDDCIENIFSNIKKRKNYQNLFGMGIQGLEKGVCISRPLLSITKADIFKFAHTFSIPYTWDSTPSWCERGRLRDILIPSIKSFDPTIIPGLIELVNNYRQIYSVFAESTPTIFFEDNLSQRDFRTQRDLKCQIDCSKEIYIIDY